MIPEKEKIIFNQKSQIQNLKKHYSCEFKQKEYIFNFTNSTINEVKEIRVKNNGYIKWPKGFKIHLKKNDKIKLFGVTEHEVNPGEEIDIKLNIIIDIHIENIFKFNSNLIISYKDDYLFSFNQCKIQIIIRNENVENKIPKSNKGKIFKNIINKSYNYNNISNSTQKSLNKSYSIQEFNNNNSYTQIYKKKYRKNSLNKCASKQNNLLIFQ